MDLRIIIRDRRQARLVNKARRGDRKAFQALFDELYDSVHAYLDRRCQNVHDTEDLVSTVFHKLLNSIDNFDSNRGSVTAWVMIMARHALIDHLRRSRETMDIDGMADILAGPGTDPLEGVIRTEEAERVRQELGRLPCETRELLALRYGEGLTHPEIAAITGVSETAVRQRTSRAVKLLRERVVGTPEPGGEVDYAIR